jgi:hypothetical protein
MQPLLIAAPLLLLGACSQPQDAPPAAPPATFGAGVQPAAGPVAQDREVLGPQGIGAIVVGEAPPPVLTNGAGRESDGCDIYSDKARRIYAMTDGKVVARITAMSGSPVKTARGIATGASEAEVRKAYPDLKQEPHKYVEAPAKYLDWRPGGGTTGLRFEIDASGKVSAIHAGREPEIEYVEGCA